MSDIIEIKDLLSSLPLLIIYIVPGYVFISEMNFILGNKKVDDKNILLKSVAISFIITNLLSVLYLKTYNANFDISLPKNIFFTILITIVFAYVVSIFLKSEICGSAFKYLNISNSLKSDIFNDLVDFELGMWIRVYLQDEKLIYQGKIRKFDRTSEDGNTYIALSNYLLQNYDGEILENSEEFNTRWVLISLKDNFRIELFYEPNSNKTK
jgi:hypothetical protein